MIERNLIGISLNVNYVISLVILSHFSMLNYEGQKGIHTTLLTFLYAKLKGSKWIPPYLLK